MKTIVFANSRLMVEVLTKYRAICTNILHFPARVLVIQAARAASGERGSSPDTVLAVSGDRVIRVVYALIALMLLTGTGNAMAFVYWD